MEREKTKLFTNALEKSTKRRDLRMKKKNEGETVKRRVVIEEGQSEDKTIVRSRANAFVSKCNVTLRSE